MTNRPDIDSKLSGKTFHDFYYLKEELVDFCRSNGLPTSGGKIELTDRIAYYLDKGKILSANTTRRVKSVNTGIINEEAIKCWKHKKGVQGHNSYEQADYS